MTTNHLGEKKTCLLEKKGKSIDLIFYWRRLCLTKSVLFNALVKT
jgi:hypothetical protein